MKMKLRRTLGIRMIEVVKWNLRICIWFQGGRLCVSVLIAVERGVWASGWRLMY